MQPISIALDFHYVNRIGRERNHVRSHVPAAKRHLLHGESVLLEESNRESKRHANLRITEWLNPRQCCAASVRVRRFPKGYVVSAKCPTYAS